MIYEITIILHILFACIWTGGYIIFSAVYLPQALKKKDSSIIRTFERNFGKIGIPALGLQLITGIILAFRYIPNFFDWFSFSNFIHANITLKLILVIIILFLAHYLKLKIIPKMSNENMGPASFYIILIAVMSIVLVLIGTSFRFGGL